MSSNPPHSPLARLLCLPTRAPRATLVGLALVLVAAGAGASLRGLETQFGIEQFVPSGDPEFERYTELIEDFGRDDNTVFVFVEQAGIFEIEGAREVLALSDALADSPRVESVIGFATATLIQDRGGDAYVGPVLTRERLASLDYPRLKTDMTQDPLYAGRVVSRDGRVAGLAVRFGEDSYGGRHNAAIAAHVRGVLARFARPGRTFYVSGGPLTQLAYVQFLIQDAALFVVATCVLLAIALWITFRGLQGVLLPLLSVGLSLYLTVAFAAVAGIPVNLLSSAIPVLVLIVGISDSIHLLTRYGEELAGGSERAAALERAVVVTAHACAMTSITTATGFLVLPTTGVPMLGDMGIVVGVGVLIAYVVTLTLIPAVAALQATPTRLPDPEGPRLLLRLGDWVMARRWLVSVGILGVVAIAVAVGAPRLRVESRVVDDLPEDHPLVQTRASVERLMGGTFPLTLLVHPALEPEAIPLEEDPAFLEKLGRFQAALDGLGGVQVYSGSVSVADYLRRGSEVLSGSPGLPPTREAAAQVGLIVGASVLEPTLDPDGRYARIEVRALDRGTAATFEFLRRAQEAFQGVFGESARLEVQGFTYLAQRVHRDVVYSSMTSFSLDFVIVAVLVCFLFRSLRLTVLAIIPNVVPLLLTVAFMGAVGIDLRISSSIVFSIVFGIAVDDTVHFLARYHEERTRGLSPTAAARRTIATTGRAMLFMSFVLALGFSVLLLSAFSPNRVLGLLMAVTVLSGIVGDLALLPALLVIGEPDARPEASA